MGQFLIDLNKLKIFNKSKNDIEKTIRKEASLEESMRIPKNNKPVPEQIIFYICEEHEPSRHLKSKICDLCQKKCIPAISYNFGESLIETILCYTDEDFELMKKNFEESKKFKLNYFLSGSHNLKEPWTGCHHVALNEEGINDDMDFVFPIFLTSDSVRVRKKSKNSKKSVIIVWGSNVLAPSHLKYVFIIENIINIF